MTMHIEYFVVNKSHDEIHFEKLWNCSGHLPEVCTDKTLISNKQEICYKF